MTRKHVKACCCPQCFADAYMRCRAVMDSYSDLIRAGVEAAIKTKENDEITAGIRQSPDKTSLNR